MFHYAAPLKYPHAVPSGPRRPRIESSEEMAPRRGGGREP
jgi:hypothetical protein